MIKKVEDKVKEIVEGAKQSLHITLDNYAREDAKKMLIERGLEMREHWDGPIFKDIQGFQLSANLVSVTLKDGVSYAYPMSSVARIKHWSE